MGCGTKNSMKVENHRRTALPTYLKLSFSYAVMLPIPPVAVALLATRHSGQGLASVTGPSIVQASHWHALIAAVGEDIRRNWTVQERTVPWNPKLMWRNFIYLGAVGFFLAAFLAYHQC